MLYQGRVIRDVRDAHRAGIKPFQVSWWRLVLVVTVCLCLMVTNPANRPFWEEIISVWPLSSSLLSSSSSSSSKPIKSSSSSRSFSNFLRRSTNYLFFTVEHDSLRSKVTLHAMGQSLDCVYSSGNSNSNNNNNNRRSYPNSYHDESSSSVLSYLSSQCLCPALAQHLATGRPLLYQGDSSSSSSFSSVSVQRNDRAFTAHRLLLWTYLGMYLISLCLVNYPLAYYASFSTNRPLATLLLQPLWHLLAPHPQAPLWSTLQAMAESSAWIYPAWKRMEILILVQQSDFWFRLSPTNDTLNFTWSVVCFLMVAVLIQAASTRTWLPSSSASRRQWQRGLGSLVLGAMALGYLRGSHNLRDPDAVARSRRQVPIVPWLWPWVNNNNNNYNNNNNPYEPTALIWTADPVTVSWSKVILMATVTHSWDVALWWVLANLAGAMLGEYHFHNQILVVFANSVVQAVEDTMRLLMGGYRRMLRQLQYGYF